MILARAVRALINTCHEWCLFVAKNYEHDPMDDGSDGRRDGPLRRRKNRGAGPVRIQNALIRTNPSGCYNSPTT